MVIQLTVGWILMTFLALTTTLWVSTHPLRSDNHFWSEFYWRGVLLRWLMHFFIRFVALYFMAEAGEHVVVLLTNSWSVEGFKWFKEALIAPLRFF